MAFTLGCGAIAVWLGWDNPTAQWWAKWLNAYDNRRAYADDAPVAAILLVDTFEGCFMFPARKRIALPRGGGGNEGRAATEAELMPVIREPHERIRKPKAAVATPTPEPAPAPGAAAHRPAALLCR